MMELLGIIGIIVEEAIAIFCAHCAIDKLKDRPEEKEQLEVAGRQLFEVWFEVVIGIFQLQGYEKTVIQQFFFDYQADWKAFVKDESVLEELLKPLSSPTTEYSVDAQLLQARWQILELRTLPEDFDVASVCRAFTKRLQKAGVVTKELRALYREQLRQETKNTLVQLRGVYPNFDLTHYAKRVREKYRVLELSGLAPAERDDNLPILLRHIFVEQSVRRNPPPRELPKEMVRKLCAEGEVKAEDMPEFWEDELRLSRSDWYQGEMEAVLPVLAHRERLVILGDPGSGKSTLARYLLLSLLSEKVPESLAALKEHLPLLVELRNYIAELIQNHCTTFLEYWHYLGKTQGYALNEIDLDQLLQTQPTLVMFDGLDEIFDPRQRDKIIEEIIGFSSRYPLARVLVTSRIVGYHGKALLNAQFYEYTLLEFTEAQIQQFTTIWFNAVYAGKPDEVEFRCQRIATALERAPAIQQLASNPLLLTIIAIIAKHQELPRERAKLYEHAAKVLCHHWDVTGHKIPLKELPTDFLSEDDKLAFLRQLAWRMQSSPKGLAGNFITRGDLQAEVERFLNQRWPSTPAIEVTRIAQAMIQQLRERNFILCLWGANVYGFVHRTFLEYFCAAHIVYGFKEFRNPSEEQLKTEIFLAHYEDEAWQEVLRLICGMITGKVVANSVVAIVEAITDVGSDLRMRKSLIFAKNCLDEVADKPPTAPVAKRIFEKWQHIATDKQGGKLFRIDAIGVLAKHFREQPDTFPLLWQLATDEQESNWVREQAILSLTEHFHEQPETLPLLRQFVTDQQKSGWVHGGVIGALAKHFREHPETSPLLRQFVTDKQEHEEVRQAVVMALATNYEEVQQKLLVKDLESSYAYGTNDWLPPDSVIDDARIQHAAEELGLPPATIRQHYETIAQDIPLKLTFKRD